jgi:hypothetical protein
MIAECGTGAHLILSNIGVNGGPASVGGVLVGLQTNTSIAIPCSGSVTVTWDAQLYTFTVLVSLLPWEALVQNLLLGLAGVLAGGALVYAWLKTGL